MGGIKDYNSYDFMMERIVKTIRKTTDKFYLLGLCLENVNLNHELAHGMFYTNEDYRNEIMYVMDNVFPPLEKKRMSKLLENRGYAKNVLIDEVHAYSLKYKGFKDIFDKYKSMLIFSEEKRIKIDWK